MKRKIIYYILTLLSLFVVGILGVSSNAYGYDLVGTQELTGLRMVATCSSNRITLKKLNEVDYALINEEFTIYGEDITLATRAYLTNDGISQDIQFRVCGVYRAASKTYELSLLLNGEVVQTAKFDVEAKSVISFDSRLVDLNDYCSNYDTFMLYNAAGESSKSFINKDTMYRLTLECVLGADVTKIDAKESLFDQTPDINAEYVDMIDSFGNKDLSCYYKSIVPISGTSNYNLCVYYYEDDVLYELKRKLTRVMPGTFECKSFKTNYNKVLSEADIIEGITVGIPYSAINVSSNYFSSKNKCGNYNYYGVITLSSGATYTVKNVIEVVDEVKPLVDGDSIVLSNSNTLLTKDDILKHFRFIDEYDGDLSKVAVLNGYDNYLSGYKAGGSFNLSVSAADKSGNSASFDFIINVDYINNNPTTPTGGGEVPSTTPSTSSTTTPSKSSSSSSSSSTSTSVKPVTPSTSSTSTSSSANVTPSQTESSSASSITSSTTKSSSSASTSIQTTPTVSSTSSSALSSSSNSSSKETNSGTNTGAVQSSVSKTSSSSTSAKASASSTKTEAIPSTTSSSSSQSSSTTRVIITPSKSSSTTKVEPSTSTIQISTTPSVSSTSSIASSTQGSTIAVSIESSVAPSTSTTIKESITPALSSSSSPYIESIIDNKPVASSSLIPTESVIPSATQGTSTMPSSQTEEITISLSESTSIELTGENTITIKSSNSYLKENLYSELAKFGIYESNVKELKSNYFENTNNEGVYELTVIYKDNTSEIFYVNVKSTGDSFNPIPLIVGIVIATIVGGVVAFFVIRNKKKNNGKPNNIGDNEENKEQTEEKNDEENK